MPFNIEITHVDKKFGFVYKIAVDTDGPPYCWAICVDHQYQVCLVIKLTSVGIAQVKWHMFRL